MGIPLFIGGFKFKLDKIHFLLLKILCIVPSYKPAFIYGGPVRSIASLCESLVMKGQDVTVYTTRANGKKELDVEPGKAYNVDGVKVYYFSRQTKGHSNYSRGLFKALRDSASTFDVIHIHSWWNFIAVISASIAIKKGKLPVISLRGTMTSFSFTHRNKIIKEAFHQWIGKKLLQQCFLHVTSDEEKTKLQHFVDTARILCISNLLDLPKSVVGQHKDELFIKLIFIGRIHPVKNLEMLFQVLSELHSVPYQLQILGDGEPQYVHTLKSKTAHMPSIQWKGDIDGEEKFKLLANADLLVVPSHIENFGNVVIESLSQGTPVLVSDQVGNKDYVLKNNIGWVAPNEPQQWISALERIWSDLATRQQMRARAIQSVRRDFDKKEQVLPYIKMYEEVKMIQSRQAFTHA